MAFMTAPVQGLFGIAGGGQTPSSLLTTAGYNTGVDPDALAAIHAQRKQQQKLAGIQMLGASGVGPTAAGAQTAAGIQQALSAGAAGAAATRYGMAPGAAAYNASQLGAGQMGAALEQGSALRAREMTDAGLGANATLGSMNQTATTQGALAQAAQAPIAQIAGNEESQANTFGTQMLGAMTGGLAGGGSSAASSLLGGGGGSGAASSLLGALAHGGASGGPVHALTGERGPEIDLPLGGGAPRLIDRPTVFTLGKNGPEAVLPLRRGSAPYHPGVLAVGHPSRMAPPDFAHELAPEAVRALMGRGHVFQPGGGARPLDRAIAPAIARALAQQPEAMHPALMVQIAIARKKRAPR